MPNGGPTAWEQRQEAKKRQKRWDELTAQLEAARKEIAELKAALEQEKKHGR